MEEREERVVHVAGEIQQYLETHPQSFDSLEGIATWWVLRQRVQVEVDLVRAALEQLESRGVILSARIGHRREPVYRLANKLH